MDPNISNCQKSILSKKAYKNYNMDILIIMFNIFVKGIFMNQYKVPLVNID